MPHISLQMYTLREFMTTPEQVDETLRRVAEIGYRYVQPSVPAFLTAKDFKALLDRHGLKADSFSYMSPDMTGGLGQILATAETLQTAFVRAGAIPMAESYTKEGFEHYAAKINPNGRLLRSHGLTYIYHFHAYEFVDLGGIRGIDILLEQTDPDAIHFQPDVHWMAAAGEEPSVTLDQFKGRAEYIHMQGYAILPDPEEKRPVARCTVPVGQGNLNWPGIVAAARRIGIEMFVVEQDDCYTDAFESVRQSFEALRALGIKP